jgi:hypothetical protein
VRRRLSVDRSATNTLNRAHTVATARQVGAERTGCPQISRRTAPLRSRPAKYPDTKAKIGLRLGVAFPVMLDTPLCSLESTRHGGSHVEKNGSGLGAGMLGVSVAVHLRRRGWDVVLVDRQGPGKGASFSNGGSTQREAWSG